MQLDFMVVVSNLVGLFLMMAVGYAAAKSGALDASASKIMTALLLKIAIPCIIFNSLATRPYEPDFLLRGLLTAGFCFVFFPAVMFLSRAAAGRLGVPMGTRGIWSFACTFCNQGFMGYPVLLALFGAEGMALGVFCGVAFNLYTYSLGAMAIASDSGMTAERRPWTEFVFTRLNAALVLSLIVYFFRIPLPTMIAVPVSHLSNLTTPLSMLVVGMALAKSDPRKLFNDRHAWSASVIRLVLVPLTALLLLRILPVNDPMVIDVIVVTMAMPAAGAATMLAEAYGGNLDFAAKVTFLSSLISVITIPAICMLF